jgi:DNA-binding MarR family transcriptional regulator
MSPRERIVSTAIISLQRLSDLFCERREQLAREAALTVQQWCVLEKISEEHFMPSMFAKNRDSSAAAVSKVIRQLLDKGVIRVSVRENDGRQRQYTLTDAGEQVVERLRASRQRAIDAIWSSFSEHELAQFVSFSEQLGSRLEDYIRSERSALSENADSAASVCSTVSTAEYEPAYASQPAAPAVARPAAITSTNKFID